MDKGFLYLHLCNRWWTCTDHLVTTRCSQVLHSRSVTCGHAWILGESLRSTYYKVIVTMVLLISTAHDKGCVPVYVSCDGKNLSRPVPFLYKENPENKPSSRFSWFSVNGKQMLALNQANYSIPFSMTVLFTILGLVRHRLVSIRTGLTAKQCNFKCELILLFVHLWISKQTFSLSGKELKSLLVERLVQLENRLTQSLYRDGPVPSLQQVTTQIYLSIPCYSRIIEICWKPTFVSANF